MEESLSNANSELAQQLHRIEIMSPSMNSHEHMSPERLSSAVALQEFRLLRAFAALLVTKTSLSTNERSRDTSFMCGLYIDSQRLQYPKP
jgi:hypothetical protein